MTQQFNKNYSVSQSGKVSSNGIEIYYESFGNPSNPAIVLIMGLDATVRVVVARVY